MSGGLAYRSYQTVFADTAYWVALLNAGDDLHETANVAVASLPTDFAVITTQAVLFEVLNHFSRYGAFWRQQAAQTLSDIYATEGVTVIDTSESRFFAAVALYRARPDKQYSLTDCLSFVVMRERGIVASLTHDVHFVQEGFVALLREIPG